jgi:hypothetical protein
MERLINSDSMVTKLWNPITLRNLKIDTIHSPKRRFELELHATKSQKTPIIDTAVKSSQNTILLDH